MVSTLRRMWVRLPTLLRGAVVAIVILVLDSCRRDCFLIANLDVTPAVPWFLAATVAWLWCFWSYLEGRWLASGQSKRAPRTCAGRRCHSGLVLVPRCRWVRDDSVLAELSHGSHRGSSFRGARAADHLGPYPTWTVAAFFRTSRWLPVWLKRLHSGVHAVNHRASPRSGRGNTSVAVLFYLAHMSHAYATRPSSRFPRVQLCFMACSCF